MRAAQSRWERASVANKTARRFAALRDGGICHLSKQKRRGVAPRSTTMRAAPGPPGPRPGRHRAEHGRPKHSSPQTWCLAFNFPDVGGTPVVGQPPHCNRTATALQPHCTALTTEHLSTAALREQCVHRECVGGRAAAGCRGSTAQGITVRALLVAVAGAARSQQAPWQLGGQALPFCITGWQYQPSLAMPRGPRPP